MVAKLELTGERIQLLADEALKRQSQQKQLYIKMVAGVRSQRYEALVTAPDILSSGPRSKTVRARPSAP